jgi:hypothetical protein
MTATTIQIPLDKINVDRSFTVGGEYTNESDRLAYWDVIILKVKGLNFAGFTLGFVPAGYAGRQHQGGPLVPGPWAYAFANSAVISDCGGTRDELDRAAAEGRLYHAELGDRLDIDGAVFEIQSPRNSNGNLSLVKVDA